MRTQKITFLLAGLLLCWSGVFAQYALNVSCSNQITAIANGNTGPYYFTWTRPDGKIINPTDNTVDKIQATIGGIYSVIITNNYGCETILDVSIWDPICKENTLTDNNLSIYPNPFSDGLSIDFESDLDTSALLQITDLMGKVFYEEQVSFIKGKNSQQIKLDESLPSGVYMLNLKVGEQPVQTVKMIKD